MPSLEPATSMLSRSSTMSMISSTTSPIERPAVGEHQDRLRALGPDADAFHLHQRHQLVAVLHHVAAVGEFDLVDGDLLQPRDEPERHRLGLIGAGAEHQQRGHLLGGAGAHGGVLVGDLVAGRACGAERLGDAVGIDDHDHGAVAQNGVAGEHVDVAQFGRHRLDHDLLGVEHAVDHDAEGLVADLGDHDKAVLGIGGGAVVDLQQLLQMHQRQQLVAQPQDRGVLDALDAVLGVGAGAHQFDHRELGNGKAVAGGFDDQGGDDLRPDRRSRPRPVCHSPALGGRTGARPRNSEHRIERIKDTAVLRLRNKLLPLMHLKKLLKIDDGSSSDPENGFIVVTQVGNQTFGIVVDGVFHTEEIVVKPMSTKLRHIDMFSGNTILGDGAVIMIIDPNGIAKALGAAGSAQPSDRRRERRLRASAARADDLAAGVSPAPISPRRSRSGWSRASRRSPSTRSSSPTAATWCSTATS